MKTNTKSILITDDHLVVIKGLEILIKDKFPDSEVYNAQNYDDTLEILKTMIFDLVLLDININGEENVTVIKKIKDIQPNVKVLVFSSYDESQYGFRYVNGGADGYLNKFCSEDKLEKAIRYILKNGYFYSDLLKTKLKQVKTKNKNKNPIDTLSEREFEVSKLLINGLGNLEISNKLNIKKSTVSTYKNRIFNKLNVDNVVVLSELFKNVKGI